MHNKYRGEITATLDGRDYRLCLSLGALAELESVFGEEDMIALACRFESGRLRAADAVRVIGAGLRGAGNDISDEAVAGMRHAEGAAGYVGVVVTLLAATFGGDEPQDDVMREGASQSGAAPEVGRGVPFPGRT